MIISSNVYNEISQKWIKSKWRRIISLLTVDIFFINSRNFDALELNLHLIENKSSFTLRINCTSPLTVVNNTIYNIQIWNSISVSIANGVKSKSWIRISYAPHRAKIVPYSLLNSSWDPFSIRPRESSVPLSERISEACEAPAWRLSFFINLKIRLLLAAKFAAPHIIAVFTTVFPPCSIPPVRALHPASRILAASVFSEKKNKNA